MKLALVLLVLLPLVLAVPVDEKRFIEQLHLGSLVDQLKGAVTSSTGHAGCVTLCHTIAGVVSFLCDAACTEVLHLVAG